jgi:hypothetical protein
MSALDPRTADRLARICGLFSSDHDGERANAAAAADRILRAEGLTWADVLVPRAATIEAKIDFALANIGALTLWEKGFLHSIEGRHSLSIRQQEILNEIVAKIGGAP